MPARIVDPILAPAVCAITVLFGLRVYNNSVPIVKAKKSKKDREERKKKGKEICMCNYYKVIVLEIKKSCNEVLKGFIKAICQKEKNICSEKLVLLIKFLK